MDHGDGLLRRCLHRSSCELEKQQSTGTNFLGGRRTLACSFGLAKRLQLQGEFTNWIRIEARAYYLYDHRKLAEYPFLVLVAGTALCIVLRFRDQFARCGLAIVIASLVSFLLIAFLLI